MAEVLFFSRGDFKLSLRFYKNFMFCLTEVEGNFGSRTEFQFSEIRSLLAMKVLVQGKGNSTKKHFRILLCLAYEYHIKKNQFSLVILRFV